MLESASTEEIQRYQALLDKLEGLSPTEENRRARRLPRLKAQDSLAKQRQRFIIWVLQFATEPLSFRQISDRVFDQFGRSDSQLLRKVCSEMVKEGELIKIRAGNFYKYQLADYHPTKSLVDFEIGDWVVEFRGTRSERRGQIVDFRKMAGRKDRYPVISFEDGTTTFSHPDRLTHLSES